jgi:hypothetical protein
MLNYSVKRFSGQEMEANLNRNRPAGCRHLAVCREGEVWAWREAAGHLGVPVTFTEDAYDATGQALPRFYRRVVATDGEERSPYHARVMAEGLLPSVVMAMLTQTPVTTAEQKPAAPAASPSGELEFDEGSFEAEMIRRDNFNRNCPPGWKYYANRPTEEIELYQRVAKEIGLKIKTSEAYDSNGAALAVDKRMRIMLQWGFPVEESNAPNIMEHKVEAMKRERESSFRMMDPAAGPRARACLNQNAPAGWGYYSNCNAMQLESTIADAVAEHGSARVTEDAYSHVDGKQLHGCMRVLIPNGEPMDPSEPMCDYEIARRDRNLNKNCPSGWVFYANRSVDLIGMYRAAAQAMGLRIETSEAYDVDGNAVDGMLRVMVQYATTEETLAKLESIASEIIGNAAAVVRKAGRTEGGKG